VPDYHVVIKPSAAKDLDKLPVNVAARIAAKIESPPRPHGVNKLEGEPTRWRIRVSDWRVIFAIDDGKRVVDIIYIRHRSKAYE
jgi:mRNA interferase RelE/StbE